MQFFTQKTNLSLKISTALCSSLFLLTACNDKSTYNFDTTTPEIAATPAAAFSPAKGGPTTNNLLFGTDGTLNFPNPADPTTGEKNPVRTALNTLDGFSTTNPITTSFGTPLDQASLAIGDSVHVFEVNTAQTGAVISVIRELDASEVVAKAAGEDGSTLAIIPLKPLKENTSYMVVLTNAIKDENKKPVTAAGSFLLLSSQTDLATLPASTFPATATQTAAEALAQAKGLQGLIGTMIAAAGTATPPVDKAKIVLGWTFTTQSITAALEGLADNAIAQPINMKPIGQTTKDLNPQLPGLASISIGTLDVPYYLTAPSAANPLAALTSFWKGANGKPLTRTNTVPNSTDTLSIPVILSVPIETASKKKPANGWPVIMYQHGITRKRTDMIALADTMAQAGFAIIAIDLPLHGIHPDDPTASLRAGGSLHNTLGLSNETRESTFDMDFVSIDADGNQTAGPDGKADPSGTHFINLASLLTARDNVRQAVSNLLILRRSIAAVDDLDGSKVGFVAHSLGGIIGTTYLGVEDIPTVTSLITTGGGIAHLLDGSAAFGPRVRAGLADKGITGADYQAFLGAAQAVLDSADPINFAATAASNHPIHMIEVIDDQVVPNNVPALSGTEPMAAIMGLQSITAITSNTQTGAEGIVRFTEGEHGSLLSPAKTGGGATDLLHVTTEIQTQIATYQATSGATIAIGNADIIKQ